MGSAHQSAAPEDGRGGPASATRVRQQLARTRVDADGRRRTVWAFAVALGQGDFVDASPLRSPGPRRREKRSRGKRPTLAFGERMPHDGNERRVAAIPRLQAFGACS